MTIQEIKEKKRKAENEIAKILTAFKNETDVFVKEVKFFSDTWATHTDSGQGNIKVKIIVNIGLEY